MRLLFSMCKMCVKRKFINKNFNECKYFIQNWCNTVAIRNRCATVYVWGFEINYFIYTNTYVRKKEKI